MLALFSIKHRMSVFKDEDGDLANNYSVITFTFKDIFFILFPRSIPGMLFPTHRPSASRVCQNSCPSAGRRTQRAFASGRQADLSQTVPAVGGWHSQFGHGIGTESREHEHGCAFVYAMWSDDVFVDFPGARTCAYTHTITDLWSGGARSDPRII